jgi:hypothetical protein
LLGKPERIAYASGMSNQRKICGGALSLFFVFVLGSCTRGGDDDAFLKDPATVEQAAGVLDLSQLPVLEGADESPTRAVASLTYQLKKGDVESVFASYRKELAKQGWKESSRDTSVTPQSATTSLRKKGFVVSLSVFSASPPNINVSIVDHGNIKLDALPRPPGTKPVYVGDLSAMYVTDGPVAETSAALRKLLLERGWKPYGIAADTSWFKQNAVRLSATVSSAPAQGGKTMITFNSELMSADLPAPPDADDLRYSEATKELVFESPADKKEVTAFYRKELASSHWEPTLEKLVDIGERPTMIFRNPGKDMLTLSFSIERGGRTSVSLQFQTAAEIAELERRLNEQAAKYRAEHGQK